MADGTEKPVEPKMREDGQLREGEEQNTSLLSRVIERNGSMLRRIVKG